MGEVKKINGEYYIEFHARGLLYQQKAGADYDSAVRMLESVEGKIRQGEMGTIVRDVELDVFIETFLNSSRLEHTLKTFNRLNSVCTHFLKFFKEKYPQYAKLSSVTPDCMEDYRVFLLRQASLRKPAVKAHILNLSLVLLEALFDEAIRLGYLNDHPMTHLKWVPQINLKKLPHLKEEDLRRMLEERATDEAEVLQMMFLTGLSVGELEQIHWSEIDFENNRIKIVEEKHKAAHPKERFIPMHTVIKDLLFNIQKTNADLGKFFKNYMDLDKEFSRTLLQNTFAYFALKRNIRLTDLYKFMGFDDVGKVMKYFEWVSGKI